MFTPARMAFTAATPASAISRCGRAQYLSGPRCQLPQKWLYAMYLLVTARKGISSLQLAKQIGVTQKTGWFMLQRLREACGHDPTKLAGIVECDFRLNDEAVQRHTLDRLASVFSAAIGRLTYKDLIA
ncbi:MAG: hypothetical protein U5K75_12190 [Ahrensia sp.]|nr:hypothetical protein [Ahrensia sp.]